MRCLCETGEVGGGVSLEVRTNYLLQACDEGVLCPCMWLGFRGCRSPVNTWGSDVNGRQHACLDGRSRKGPIGWPCGCYNGMGFRIVVADQV
jgi:hypothetical protein